MCGFIATWQGRSEKNEQIVNMIFEHQRDETKTMGSLVKLKIAGEFKISGHFGTGRGGRRSGAKKCKSLVECGLRTSKLTDGPALTKLDCREQSDSPWSGPGGFRGLSTGARSARSDPGNPRRRARQSATASQSLCPENPRGFRDFE